MRQPEKRRDGLDSLEVPMTPMIDVVFQLMIFFVCTVSFRATEELLPANLLAAGAVPVESPLEPELEDLERIVVRIVSEGATIAWTVNDRPCGSLDQVRDLLYSAAELASDLPIVLDVDGEIPLGEVVDVYDLCRLAGFKKIQFAASTDAGMPAVPGPEAP
jgi:biopolymer transport protein ExbD